jgi:hypothetical protein
MLSVNCFAGIIGLLDRPDLAALLFDLYIEDDAALVTVLHTLLRLSGLCAAAPGVCVIL